MIVIERAPSVNLAKLRETIVRLMPNAPIGTRDMFGNWVHIGLNCGYSN